VRRRWLFAAVFCLVLFVLAIPKLFVVPRLSQRLEAELIDYFSAEGGEVYLIAPWGLGAPCSGEFPLRIWC